MCVHVMWRIASALLKEAHAAVARRLEWQTAPGVMGTAVDATATALHVLLMHKTIKTLNPDSSTTFKHWQAEVHHIKQQLLLLAARQHTRFYLAFNATVASSCDTVIHQHNGCAVHQHRLRGIRGDSEPHDHIKTGAVLCCCRTHTNSDMYTGNYFMLWVWWCLPCIVRVDPNSKSSHMTHAH